MFGLGSLGALGVPAFDATPRASLTLNFTNTSTLDSRITFSRGSQATYFDSTGVLRYAANNMLTYSEQFNNAAWVKGSSTVSANATTAPDGTTTADKLIPDNGISGGHVINAVSIVSGTTYTCTVYAKAGEFTELRLLGDSVNFGGGVSNQTGVYNLSNGSASVGAGTPTVSMTAVGNGWYRCIWTKAATATASAGVQIRINTTGDGTSGIFIWGAQLEIGSTANTYNATTASAYYAPRFDYDPVTLAARGLLIEEQRTNSIRNSSMIGAVVGTPGTLPTNWTQSNNTGLAANVVGTGTENGITYIDLRINGTTTGTGQTNILLETSTGVAALTGQSWSFSPYLKVQAGALTNITSINLVLQENTSAGAAVTAGSQATSIPTTALGSYRPTYTRTLSGGATVAAVQPYIQVNISTGLAVDVTLRIGLPQLEQGAFATSVIPTTTAAVQRNADSATMTGTNFSSWYNATEGTLYGEFLARLGINQGAAIIRNDAGTNSVRVRKNSANNYSGVLRDGGTRDIAVTPSPALTEGQTVKIAVAFKTSDCAMTGGGQTPNTQATFTLNAMTTFDIGASVGAGESAVNGHIRRIAYYKRRLSNAELQAITR